MIDPTPGPLAKRVERVRAISLSLALTARYPQGQTTSSRMRANFGAQQRAAADRNLIMPTHRDAPMTRACTVEQPLGLQSLILTVRNPEGGFHRSLATRDGSGVRMARNMLRSASTASTSASAATATACLPR